MGLVEQAMLLANLIWESTGFQYKEEIACKGTRRPTARCPYGRYYGRGYIQLSWVQNYRTASQEIYGDDRLVQVPELVAKEDGAWRTAVWYWKWAVRPRLADHDALASLAFGHAVRAINGALECTLPSKNSILNRRWHPKRNFEAARNRLVIFNALLEDWGLVGESGQLGTLEGCFLDVVEKIFSGKLNGRP